jgi:MFS family permease
MTISEQTSNRNFNAFLWHAVFLALAQNFTDVDTIIPAMLIEAGGGAVHVGIMSAIMIGGGGFSQLFFAPYISNRLHKKNFLLLGINARIFTLVSLGLMFVFSRMLPPGLLFWSIFFFIAIFSLGGAFANISYVDIMGKAILPNRRMAFFSTKQSLSGVILFFSSLLAAKTLTLYAFPTNYALMFLIGGAALLVASGGFWAIREDEETIFRIDGLGEFFRVLSKELRENGRLVHFLGLINVQGIAISFLPFVILYAKRSFHTGSGDTGSFLLYKVAGIVLVGLTVLLTANKIRYKPMLYANVTFSVSLAFITMFARDPMILRLIFLIGGIVFSLYSITMNGLLLEISTHHNRAIYTGFLGAGSILPMIFPFFGGWFINRFGFPPFFLLFALIVSSAFYFIAKIDCRK